VNLLTRLLSEGRQGKRRVVLVGGTLPDSILRDDVRARKAAIIAKNGPTEWFAQLLMNELHEHLGVYSVIGVKMGLRAAELLNAPQHGMEVVSHVPAGPPASCLNDGIIVATGSTPGRCLFTHTPAPQRAIAVTFAYNGRRITLKPKEEYQAEVRARFEALLEKHTLEDHEYWQAVRQMGLDVWENWHRRDLFEIVDGPAAPH
jgi:pyrimidine-specific ribonucleoside hydrolase